MRRKRARFLGIAAAAAMLAALAPAPVALGTAGAAQQAEIGKNWIVTLRPGVDPTTRAGDLARGAGGQLGALFLHALSGFVFTGTPAAAAALQRNPEVRTVVADATVHAVAETLPAGIQRIDASDPTQPDAHDSGFTGAGARIAILDTGIDLTHPDLIANLDTALGINCMTGGPPQDGHGHGTHVAGIAAAVEGNAKGVIGVAPQARLVPVKVLDDSGSGEWSNVICGIDYITGLALDADPGNDVDVANMSLGDTGGIGTCTDGGLREAICNSVAAGIVYVAAAGNSTVDASTFIPAAFPEVITVSAMVDRDGKPGGLGGCALWVFYCDDTLAEFSNFGSSVDVTAPGYDVYSTWTGGGYQFESGTSMAAPHVAGVAALVRAARPNLTPADIEELLKTTGECPNGAYADADGTDSCTGKGQWTNDPDGYGEPLVNALRAAQAAPGWSARPAIQITTPANGSAVSGLVTVAASASDDEGVAAVEFSVNGRLVTTDSDGTDGWTFQWDAGAAFGGVYSLTARAIDVGGRTATDGVDVTTGANLQGSWVGTYGGDGYALFSWTSTSDLVLLPQASLTVERGLRSSEGVTTDIRGLQSPDETERRVAATYDGSQIRLRLNFSAAYAGDLHLYAVDWATFDRRQRITVEDGSGAQVAQLSTVFHDGAWLHFPISVAAAGVVTITIDRLAGANVLINGLFLGEGSPVPPSAPTAPQNLGATAGTSSVALSWGAALSDGGSPVTGYRVYRGTAPGTGTLLATPGNVLAYTDANAIHGTTYYYTVRAVNAVGEGSPSAERKATLADLPGAQGDWVGTYGKDGYALFAWTSTSDLVLLPQASLNVERGTRSSLGVTGEVRALESPDESERRVGADYDASQVRLKLTFSTSYSGRLHLYALDWAGTDRREQFTVDDGSGAQIVQLSTSFHDGAWMHFPISVAAGGTVTISADRLAGPNTLINGLFLGDQAPPPPPATVPGAPALVTATAGNAQVALSWNAPISDGGSAITGYVATASPGGATCSTAGATACTIVGLTNGTSYSLTVQATNAVGTGPSSNALSATPRTTPTAPQNLGATAGNANVALSWGAPLSDGGSAITGYKLYRGTAPGSGALLATLGNVLAYSDNSAINGTTYYYTVSALNLAGEGARSAEASATPVAPTTVPGAPTLVSATAGNAQVALSWTPPAGDGGSPITGYIAAASPGGATCSTTASTSCTISGLTNGTTYSFTVRATNAIGTGPASNALTAKPFTVPGAPQNLVASPNKTKGVNLSWSPPVSDGGSPVTEYRIYRRTGGGTLSLLASVGNVTTYRDAATKKGVAYFYVVRAVNAGGEGAASNEATAVAK